MLIKKGRLKVIYCDTYCSGAECPLVVAIEPLIAACEQAIHSTCCYGVLAAFPNILLKTLRSVSMHVS